MDRKLIEGLAIQAGLVMLPNPDWHHPDDLLGAISENGDLRGPLEEFAHLIAEECAKVCEGMEWAVAAGDDTTTADGMLCADAIREKFT